MSSWINKTIGRKKTSAQSAKDRLRLVLIQDRTSLSPTQMEELKNELLKVISRYVAFDQNAVKIGMTHEGREQRLTADIPIVDTSKQRVR